MNKVVKTEKLLEISLRKDFLNSPKFKVEVYNYTVIQVVSALYWLHWLYYTLVSDLI